MLKTIKKLFRQINTKQHRKIQHENLTQPITLGDIHRDGQFNVILTEQRINDIINQIKKLEKTITFTIQKPIIYANFTGYWAKLYFNMKNENECTISIQMSILMEHWLDKNKIIKPDTRTLEETIGTYHTREIIFNEPQNIYTILEIIKTASNQMAREKLKRIHNQQRLAKYLRDDVQCHDQENNQS